MTGMLSEEHQKWLTARGLDLETATRYGLFTDRQSPGGRDLVIPYRREGKTVNHKYRGPQKRFRQDAGAPKALWNEDCLRDATLVTEPLIGTNLDLIGELWDLLKDANQVVLSGDGDEPGQKLNAELARRFGAARCARIVYPEGAKDLGDILRLKGDEAVRDAVRGAQPYPVKGLYRLSDYPDVGEPVTYETGLGASLNVYLRLWRGEFIVVTGIPSHGKSRFTLEMLASMALAHKHRAAIASFEMRIAPYVRDVLREHFIGKAIKDQTLQEKRQADEWIQDAFVFIDQDPREEGEEATVDWLIEKAGDAVVRYGIDWFLLDPWNQVEHKRAHGESEADYQGRAIRKLKRFARSFDCGVVIVAHPTKDVKLPNGEIRVPTLYDISGSSHWYNAADHGIIVSGDTTTTVREIRIDKSRYRSGGHVGSAFLRLENGRLRPTLGEAA
jgi:twinkle protein